MKEQSAESVRFAKVAEVDSEPFDYDNRFAWAEFLTRVDDAIREHDPWLMLGQRPDCDEFVVDVVGDWATTLHDKNIRSVRLYRRAQIDGSGARTTCQRCGGPYDEDIDSWGCCAPCLTIELGTQNDGSESS